MPRLSACLTKSRSVRDFRKGLLITLYAPHMGKFYALGGGRLV